MNKKIIIGIIIAVLGAGAYFYATRPASAPTQDIDTKTENQAQQTDSAYKIAQNQSHAQFSITETLNGKPFTAVGTTNQIAGTIAVSDAIFDIGTITINAKTFTTDSEQRDGAIARFILKSEKPENELITFKPTKTKQTSPTQATVTGDLTISGITKPATFEINATVDGDTIAGTVTGTVQRSDFGLTIPNIPFVANVSDTINVSADIVAEKV